MKEIYPCAIIFDRYDGAYSNGKWLAFPMCYYDVPYEVDGADTECYSFWEGYTEPVGKGDTPEAALSDLHTKMGVAGT